MSAAPEVSASEWLREIETYLDLASNGVLILVDNADDARLGELGRHLLRRYPELRVVVSASELRELPERSHVLLYLREDELVPLNLARQVLKDRSLRVLVWSPRELTEEMVRRAPDFYDWISHRVQCPPDGVPGFVRLGLLAAERAEVPVLWQGDVDRLRLGVESAWPGIGFRRITIKGALYGEWVDQLRAAQGDFVLLQSGGTYRGDGSVRWAIAEAGARTRVALQGGYGFRGAHRVDPEPDFERVFSRHADPRSRRFALVLEGETFGSLLRRPSKHAPSLAELLAADDPLRLLWDDQKVLAIDAPARVEGLPREWLRNEIAKETPRDGARESRRPSALWAALATLERGRLLDDPPARPIPPEIWVECQLWRGGDRPWAEMAEIAASNGVHDAAVRWEGFSGSSGVTYARRVQASLAGRSAPEQRRSLERFTEELERRASGWLVSLAALVLYLGGPDLEVARLTEEQRRALEPAAAALVAVVHGDWRHAREHLRAALSGSPLGELEQPAVAFAAWCCDERGDLRASLRLEGVQSWRVALGVDEPDDTATAPLFVEFRRESPEASLDPAWRALADAVAAANGQAHRLAAWLAGAGLAHLHAAVTPGREHYLEGVLTLVRGRALARTGQHARSQDHLLLAAAITRRTTLNPDHPWALMADFERAWLRTVHEGAGRGITEEALTALTEALWPEHGEVRAAQELLSRI